MLQEGCCSQTAGRQVEEGSQAREELMASASEIAEVPVCMFGVCEAVVRREVHFWTYD